MRSLVTTVVLLLLGVDARPCDRALTIFHDPEVAVAVADVTVLVEAETVAGGVAHVKVVRSLAGRTFAAGAKLRVRGVHSKKDEPMRSYCGETGMEAGRRYIVIAWDPKDSDELVPVDLADGVLPDHASFQERVARGSAKPAPASSWRVDGAIAARVVRLPEREPGHVDLAVVVKNLSDKPMKLERRVWPEAVQSRCGLSVVGPKGPVAAAPSPIARKDIEDYFGEHAPPDYTLDVAPGDVTVIHLARVTTAAPGWGYKEQLGFRYWPITTHGQHTVSATCERWFGVPVTTGVMVLDL